MGGVGSVTSWLGLVFVLCWVCRFRFGLLSFLLFCGCLYVFCFAWAVWVLFVYFCCLVVFCCVGLLVSCTL